MIQLDIRSRIKNRIQTSSDLRKPTPPKNLRLLATPTPQPCIAPLQKVWFQWKDFRVGSITLCL